MCPRSDECGFLVPPPLLSLVGAPLPSLNEFTALLVRLGEEVWLSESELFELLLEGADVADADGCSGAAITELADMVEEEEEPPAAVVVLPATGTVPLRIALSYSSFCRPMSLSLARNSSISCCCC